MELSMDLSITPRRVAERHQRCSPIDPEHVLIFPQTNGRVFDPQRVKQLQTRHTKTEAWPFLYIYLQNVLKFPVQHLTDEAQQILHASLALLFPLRCLVKCWRCGIQKKINKSKCWVWGGGLMLKLVYRWVTRGSVSSVNLGSFRV